MASYWRCDDGISSNVSVPKASLSGSLRGEWSRAGVLRTSSPQAGAPRDGAAGARPQGRSSAAQGAVWRAAAAARSSGVAGTAFPGIKLEGHSCSYSGEGQPSAAGACTSERGPRAAVGASGAASPGHPGPTGLRRHRLQAAAPQPRLLRRALPAAPYPRGKWPASGGVGVRRARGHAARGARFAPPADDGGRGAGRGGASGTFRTAGGVAAQAGCIGARAARPGGQDGALH